ncbi:MAG: VPDSG-CTERM sorting domain-containing protein [Chthoniobacterales bacterium]|nr:VPDSG-CTERM sorting domain-containing protein [Chthoniobacterales bacterium]
MKSKLLLTLLATAFAGAGLTTPQAQASQINGAITFAGGAIFDTNSLATATTVNTFENVTVKSRDGDYAAFLDVGDSVAMAMPYVFVPTTPTPALWSVGGFTFDLTNSVVVLQTSNFLAITGSGTISGNGFDATPGTWSFTSQSPAADGVFSFSAGSSAQGVPEGGSTVALLGLGLVAVAFLRWKAAA